MHFPPPIGLAWSPVDERLETYRRHVEKVGDLAALVEAVTHCCDSKQPPPGWIVTGLADWLTGFVRRETKASLPAPPAVNDLPRQWAQTYMRDVQDWMIADHIDTNRDVHGLTQPEALDEAVCTLRGTPLAGSVPTLKRAWMRARKFAKAGKFQRMPTRWEDRVVFRHLAPEVEPGSSWWWIVNDDRRGNSRGQWKQRPRLLADLPPRELEKLAAEIKGRWSAEFDQRMDQKSRKK